MPVMRSGCDMGVSADAAGRAEIMLRRMARACRGCLRTSVSYCRECPCRTAADVVKEMDDGRCRLGLVSAEADPRQGGAVSDEKKRRAPAKAGQCLKKGKGRGKERIRV